MELLLINFCYQKLVNMTSKFTIGDCAGGHRLENRDKNRDVSIVPRKCGVV